MLCYERLHCLSTFKIKDMPKEKTWRIELTEHQLMLMARCVEDCHRFMSGQMEMENSTRILEHPRELWHELNELQSLVTPGISKGQAMIGRAIIVRTGNRRNSLLKRIIFTDGYTRKPQRSVQKQKISPWGTCTSERR